MARYQILNRISGPSLLNINRKPSSYLLLLQVLLGVSLRGNRVGPAVEGRRLQLRLGGGRAIARSATGSRGRGIAHLETIRVFSIFRI